MTLSTDHSLLKISVRDGIADICVNRPQFLNGMNFALLHQMHQAMEQATLDPLIEAIVIGGEGKAFVVGADLDFFIRNVRSRELWRIVKFTEAGHRLMNAIDDCPKPVVARVDGVALGAGTELALACDRVVASPQASFGFPETGLGIYPGFGGTQRSLRAVGIGLAKWLIFTGKTISAVEASKVGLVHYLVPPDAVAQTARECARGMDRCEQPMLTEEHASLAQLFGQHSLKELLALTDDGRLTPALRRAVRSVSQKAPCALRIVEKIIDGGSQLSLRDGLQLEIDHVEEIFGTEDALRGLQFRAGRQVGQPEFVGR
jgi:enoyl-CoA hydratase/3-hydroxyacyl-CoA dehydrogenase